MSESINNRDNALVVGRISFDGHRDKNPPGTDIVKSGGQQIIYTERSTPAASGEDFKRGSQEREPQENVPFNTDIIKAIAMDIGKELVDYVERMYPDAISAASSTFRLSLRNHVYNDIMCTVKITDEERLKEWLDYRAKFRRYMKRMKKAKSTEEADKIWNQAPINPAMKW